MKVLVTGCAGYLGSCLVPKILRAGHAVRGVDLLMFGDDGMRPFVQSVEFIQGDLRDSTVCERAVEGVDAVIHLAAISTDPAGKALARETFEINVEATEKLARAAKAAGIKRFVYASSGSVYHAVPPYKKEYMDEDDVLSPQGSYALSKLVAEEKLLRLAGVDFYPIILRKATLYGLGRRMRYDLEVNRYLRDAFVRGKISIIEGNIRRSFLDIQDACAAYLNALNIRLSREVVGCYNVVGESVIMGDLARRITRHLKDLSGKEVAIDVKPAESFRSYWMSEKKIKRVFGFIPARPMKEAMSEMWEDLKVCANPLDAKYDNDQYIVASGIRL